MNTVQSIRDRQKLEDLKEELKKKVHVIICYSIQVSIQV